MNPALEKTIVFLLLIVAGYLLQRKLNGKQDLRGVKVLILSVILPATIFVALLKIRVAAELLLLPVGGLLLNGLLFFAAMKALPRLGFRRNTGEWRTMLLLVPSLAPGLSCFPFVMEYLGDEALAMAALTDVGNKVFVLIILYLVAMNWYYAMRAKCSEGAAMPNRKSKVKELCLALLREPVNLVIVAAILMLSFGVDITALPAFLEKTAIRLAALMTPIVLLFIGMAVRFERRELLMILRVLAFRSGVGLLLSALALVLLPALAPAFALLLIIFPQSAVSFWPFAHMSAVEAQREGGNTGVFNVGLALNVLACSLPFSTVVILTILSCGNYFTEPYRVVLFGLIMLLVPTIYWVRGYAKDRSPAPTKTPSVASSARQVSVTTDRTR